MDATIRVNKAQAAGIASLVSGLPDRLYEIAQPADDLDVVVVVEVGVKGSSWVIGPEGDTGHFSPAARRMLGLPELHRDSFGVLRKGPAPKRV